MRHSSITFAQKIIPLLDKGSAYDIIFCSDMLNLPEFLGLIGGRLDNIPSVAYFHENQLTYPNRREVERDQHFSFSNFVTSAAAGQIWFNSQFHLDSYLGALKDFLSKMPDNDLSDLVSSIKEKSSVKYPGIEKANSTARKNEDPHILWAARWEHDKNPDQFFEAIFELAESGEKFKVSVLGESFSDVPEIFFRARERLEGRLEHFGYAESREEYLHILGRSDIVVSTARHEFFGISIVEAIESGALPLLPNRLSYPELLIEAGDPDSSIFFYDGSTKDLVERLTFLCRLVGDGKQQRAGQIVRQSMPRFYWDNLAGTYDNALLGLCRR